MSASTRHAVDGVVFLSVTGWAVNAHGQPGEAGLWLDGKPLAARIDRIVRPDVLQHLGLAPDTPACGFELRPEPGPWRDRLGGEPLVCELRIDGQTVDRLALGITEAELLAWIDAMNVPLDTPALQADASRVQRFVQALPNPGRLADALRPVGWRHAVDRIDGLRVIGWVHGGGADDERFSVHSEGCEWPAQVRRVPRDDVRQVLPNAGPLAGFELDLPASLWQVAGGRAEVMFQVRVNGWALWPRPQCLHRAALAPAVQVACESLAAPGADPDAIYRCWHLIDHAAAAGALADLPAANHLALRRQMTEEDGGRWRQELEAAPGTAEGAGDDVLAPCVWQLQRALNERLGNHLSAPGEVLVDAVARVLAEHPSAPSEAREWFLAGLVPAFCAADGLSLLRPHLSAPSLQMLSRHEGRWELSLLLPVQLLDELPEGRLSGALATLQRMSRAGTGGWLNTESVHDAVRRLFDTLQAGGAIDGTEVERCVDALLALWTDLARDPPWNRLLDAHLLSAQCRLLAGLHHLGASQADRVVASALRHYGLVPAFWARWQAESPDPGAWPEALATAQRQLCAPRGGEPGRWARGRALGCAGVEELQRHALVPARGNAELTDEALLGLHPADGLRVASRGALAEAAWRSLSPVPWPDHAAQRGRAWRAARVMATGADDAAWRVALSDLRASCVEQAGFLGLPLLQHAAQALRADSARAHLIEDAFTTGVQAALDACERRQTEHPFPPLALCAVRAGAKAWPEAWSEQARRIWGRHWPDGDSEASPTAASVLVVIRLRPGHAPAALERIATGWAAALHRMAPGLFEFRAWDPTGQTAAARWPIAPQTTLASLLQALPVAGGHQQFVLLEDDAELHPEAWLACTGVLTDHYLGRADPAPIRRVFTGQGGATLRVDPSPAGTRAARVSLGLAVSRHALAWAAGQAHHPACPLWARSSPDDEKRLADLLLSQGLPLSERGQWVAQARLPSADAPDGPYADLPAPGLGAPTVMVLGADPGEVASGGGPSRIWPTDRPPGWNGAGGSQQLVRLHDPFDGAPLQASEVGVVAVARNERLLMPHFLAHYRHLGVRRFVVADNLSTDGTREFLATQPDVTLYSVDTPYRLSHYGVSWQLAMLAEHAQGRWALVVDVDEFLVWPGCERESLAARCERLQAAGHDAAWALMVDMYPEGPLDNADFTRGSPFAEAPCFDARPALPWRLGSGSFSNSPSYVSSVRHRLLPGSPPNHYTSQKVPLVRYQPGLRWSEGLHYAAGVQRAPEPLFLAHFKYHRGFRAKVEAEVMRKQHYNDAEEYRRYRALWAEAQGMMFDPLVSRRYLDSHSFADIAWN